MVTSRWWCNPQTYKAKVLLLDHCWWTTYWFISSIPNFPVSPLARCQGQVLPCLCKARCQVGYFYPEQAGVDVHRTTNQCQIYACGLVLATNLIKPNQNLWWFPKNAGYWFPQSSVDFAKQQLLRGQMGSVFDLIGSFTLLVVPKVVPTELFFTAYH